MFRRKKKEDEGESTQETAATEAGQDPMASPEDSAEPQAQADTTTVAASSVEAAAPSASDKVSDKARVSARGRGNRVQKVGIVSSDKMQKTVVVRVDRLVLHRKYRRYVRRTSKFMAHDELGSTTGDRVRIVETRPLSAHKRWRVVEIVQKAAK
jgi:small subunit ribosomal protein S17